MYFRSKFGISLGRHFGDHLDLIFTSFWSHFVRFWRTKAFPDAVGNLIDFGGDLGTVLTTDQSKKRIAFGRPAAGAGALRRNSPGFGPTLEESFHTALRRGRPDLKASPLPPAPCQIQAVG